MGKLLKNWTMLVKQHEILNLLDRFLALGGGGKRGSALPPAEGTTPGLLQMRKFVYLVGLEEVQELVEEPRVEEVPRHLQHRAPCRGDFIGKEFQIKNVLAMKSPIQHDLYES